jgi:hypothetical protein
MLKLFDFHCEDCALDWEDLVEDEKSPCSGCGKSVDRDRVCAAKLGAFSMKDADGRRQELLRRSAAHTLSELKKAPERYGAEGIKRAREGQLKSFGGFKKP